MRSRRAQSSTGLLVLIVALGSASARPAAAEPGIRGPGSSDEPART